MASQETLKQTSIRSLLGSTRDALRDTLAMVGLVGQLEFSPVVMPWVSLRRDYSPAARLRYFATGVPWSGSPWVLRAIIFAYGLIWPLRSAIVAMKLLRRPGRSVATSGVTRGRQWLEAIWFAIRLNQCPRSYYRLRMWDRQWRPVARHFVQTQEMVHLLAYLNRDVDIGAIGNKKRFFQACQAANLPSVPVLALFDWQGEVTWFDSSRRLPDRDLFLKLLDGDRGRGAERWVFDRESDSWSRDGVRLTRTAFMDHCVAKGHDSTTLLQPCLLTHPAHAQFTTGALCSFRVTTYMDRDGRPALMGAMFKMPADSLDVDNTALGGLYCYVDVATARMGPLRNKFGIETTTHPRTGAVVTGEIVFGFKECAQLSLQAQEQLSVPWTVGWDVAMTTEGPVLIEGNPLWGGVELAQIERRCSIDKTDFGECLIERLDRKLAAAQA